MHELSARRSRSTDNRQLANDYKPETRPDISFQTFTYDSRSHLIDPDNRAFHHTAEQQGCSDLNHIGKNLDDMSAALKDSQGNDV